MNADEVIFSNLGLALKTYSMRLKLSKAFEPQIYAANLRAVFFITNLIDLSIDLFPAAEILK
jgi:hypothetical protein